MCVCRLEIEKSYLTPSGPASCPPQNSESSNERPVRNGARSGILSQDHNCSSIKHPSTSSLSTLQHLHISLHKNESTAAPQVYLPQVSRFRIFGIHIQ